MSRKTIVISSFVVGVLAIAAVLTGKKKAPAESKPAEAHKEITREISDAERRKIAQEYGRKGAAKSAEVRRAKKAAKEATKESNDANPQSV